MIIKHGRHFLESRGAQRFVDFLLDCASLMLIGWASCIEPPTAFGGIGSPNRLHAWRHAYHAYQNHLRRRLHFCYTVVKKTSNKRGLQIDRDVRLLAQKPE